MVSSFRNRVKQIPSRERFLPTTVFEEVFEMWKQLPNLPKQVPEGIWRLQGLQGRFLVMGHHAGPMGNSNPANQVSKPTASVRSLLLLLVMVVWPYVYLNYWQQAFIDLRSTEDKDDEMLQCSVMIFMTFSCVSWGVCRNPLQVLPNFPHDIHDHCAGRLDGRWFTLTILPVSKKHDLDLPPSQ